MRLTDSPEATAAMHVVPDPRAEARFYYDNVPTFAIAVDEPWWWPVLSLGVDLINVDGSFGMAGVTLAIVSREQKPWHRHRDCNAIEGVLKADGRPPFDAYTCPHAAGRIVGLVDVVDCHGDQDAEGLWFVGPYALKVQRQCLLPFAHAPALAPQQGLIQLSDEKRSSISYALTRLASGAEPGPDRRR